MRLYLIRHAKAERKAPRGRDELRMLTARGHRQAAWLAEALAGLPDRPVRLLCSPAVRALETAQPIAERLGLALESDTEIGLETNASEVVRRISEVGETPALALVGHNPTLSRVCEVLLAGVGPTGGVALRTGQAAVLDLADPYEPVGAAELVDLLRIPESDDHED